ncbi:MAG: hypothetical protein KAI17_03455 [Thiotrichaceae bacterium]|nr:hypothetical protein [Thiotrichaceae bacterium]
MANIDLKDLDFTIDPTGAAQGGVKSFTFNSTKALEVDTGTDPSDGVNKAQLDAVGGNAIDVSYTPQEPGVKTLFDFEVDSPNSLLLQLDNDTSQLQVTHAGGVSGWNSVTTNTTRVINDMAGDGTNIIGACDGGYIIRSTDNGATFVETAIDIGDDLKAILFISGVGFILAGQDGSFYKSTNGGASWVDNSAGTFDCNTLAYSATQIVGAGSGGRIFLSEDDGDSWIEFWQGIAGTGTTFYKVIYNLDATLPNGEQWVVCGDNGGAGNAYILTALDPNSWTSRTSGTTATQRGLIWSNDKYLSCGDGGVIRSSTDGQANWSNVNTTFSDDLHEITFASNTFWTVGAGGASYTSPTGNSSTFVSAPVGSPVITTDLLNLGTTNQSVYAMGASGVLEVNVSQPVFLSFARQSQHAGTIYNTQPSNVNGGCNKVEVFNDTNYFSALGTLDVNLTHSAVNDSDSLIFDIFYQFGVAPSPTVHHVELTLSSKGVDACGGVHVVGDVTDSTVGSA